MDWNEPAAVVMSHGTAAVLRTLAGVDGMSSVREIARLAAISPTRARQAVERLAEHGLLTVDSGAGSHVVRLNREHLAAEPSIALARMRERVLERLGDEVASWSLPALHVSLFGSAARGDGNTRSDIDLLVIHQPLPSLAERERWDDQLAQSGAAIQQWTGNWVGWFQASSEDLPRMIADREPLLAEWQQDAVLLFGAPVSTLLRRAS